MRAAWGMLVVAACAGTPKPPATPIADPLRQDAQRVLEAALASSEAYEKLAYLTDRIGHRLSGSAQLEQAVAWAQAAMIADGHEHVRAEEVMVPRWVRGAESAALVAPVVRELAILGLGGASGTGPEGLTADVVRVTGLEELETLAPEVVAGKIVFLDKQMPAYTVEHGSGYGEVSKVRSRGPELASKMGAAGALVRSATARSLRTPHTGATRFSEGVKPIPAAALTLEDADLLARLIAAGERPRVRLTMSARLEGEVPSANVLGELVGREKPEEIVVIGAHLDSWDVGQGAHDDGAGCVIVMQALTTLRKLGLRPRRTIRVVLYTNEENGIRGARAYPKAHEAELAHHVAAIETDSGGYAPRGFRVQGSDQTVAQVKDIVSLLAPIGATEVEAGHGGVDISTLAPAGVPLLGLWVEGSRYFDIHHTHADTLDKVDPKDLRAGVAAMAVMAWVLAEMPGRLDPIPEGEGRKGP